VSVTHTIYDASVDAAGDRVGLTGVGRERNLHTTVRDLRTLEVAGRSRGIVRNVTTDVVIPEF
jgi:hypothetical protein